MARGAALILIIDPANAATCLACPLPRGCVYESDDLAYRRLCPIWRRETGQQDKYERRKREKRREMVGSAA